MGDRNQTTADVRSKSEVIQLNSLGAENGYFCDVMINGFLVSCLCDSGANVSIINSKILENLKKDSKPEIFQ